MWVQTKNAWIYDIALGGRALPRIWPRVAGVTTLAVISSYAYHHLPHFHFSLTTTPFTLIGVPLGIFLGFRNSASYDRFWEGRKLWGALVNTTRSLARQITTFIVAPEGASPEEHAAVRQEQERLVRMVVAYVHAFRHHLRDQDARLGLDEVLTAEELAAIAPHENVPIALLGLLGEHFLAARRRGLVHMYHAPILEQSLVSLTDVQGACERIKTTPIPYSYTVLMHRIVGSYCALLPFGTAEALGWASVAVVAFVSYALLGLDSIGDELEQPFGLDPNDLALFAISRTIEINLLRRIDATEVPAPAKPHRGILA
ncbi:MAG: bestrophin family protein [Myxococcales bacterium]|jgi:putative membrane protein|nr:bestrophin family protein [Myxococcales bacterium]MBL0196994.1 bestrophin family protein [Myxococcales bacterium]